MIERLADLLTFDPIGDMRFRAEALSPRYPTSEECAADPRVITPTFDAKHGGGFIQGCYAISLSVVAAASTVDDAALIPMSSHTTFLRPGSPDEPVDVRVERVRDSR